MAEFKKIQVLGTGLSGMIGTRFQELYTHQFDFTNLDLATGVEITDKSAVHKAFAESPAKVVIHLAAFTNVSAAYEQEGDTQGLCYRINVEGTRTIATAAATYHKHMIHISTDFVFDGTKTTVYTEEDIPQPIEWYGQTKYMAEQAVQELLPQGSWTILRLAYPYQASPSRPDFLAGIVEKLRHNTLPPTFTDHTITPTFADDLAEVFAYVIMHSTPGIYHAVGSSSHTDYEIALMVKEIFGLPGEVKPGSLEEYLSQHPRPYQRTMKISNEKLQQEFGIKMKTLKEGLEKIKHQIRS